MPKQVGNDAFMPKPPPIPDSDAERPLSPTDMAVIANIKRAYKNHGEISGNQSELARRSELDPTYIGKLLRAKTSVSVTSLHRIAKALGLQPWQLLVPGDWELSNPPVLAPLTDEEKQFYSKMKEAAAALHGRTQ